MQKIVVEVLYKVCPYTMKKYYWWMLAFQAHTWDKWNESQSCFCRFYVLNYIDLWSAAVARGTWMKTTPEIRKNEVWC